MIKFLFILLLLPSISNAGLPKEDFVIDVIRDTFKEGVSPTLERLLPRGLWVCGLYFTTEGTQSGYVGVTLGGAKYKNSINGIVSMTPYFVTDVPYKRYKDSLMSYKLENKKPKYYHFVRDVNEGLIIERAVVSNHVTLPSVIMPELQTIQYTYCLPYEKKSNRKKIFNNPWERILKY